METIDGNAGAKGTDRAKNVQEMAAAVKRDVATRLMGGIADIEEVG